MTYRGIPCCNADCVAFVIILQHGMKFPGAWKTVGLSDHLRVAVVAILCTQVTEAAFDQHKSY